MELLDVMGMAAPLATGGLILLCGIALGLLIQRPTMRRLQRSSERLEAEQKEQVQVVSRLQTDRMLGANLALNLPMVVRELNRSDMNARRVPRLILQLAESVFQPEQLLFYLAVRSGDRRELNLACHQGLVDVPDAIARIPFGQGKIGWVARNQTEMLREDWRTLERREGVVVEMSHPGMRVDMIAPLVQHTPDGAVTLGVITVGGTSIGNRDDRVMLQLISNLGSLALINASNMSALRNKAHYDGLTGLLNKTQFFYQFASQLLHAGKHAQSVGVFIFDVDHFKNYNDVNGHPAGDELLRRLAAVIRENVRPEDLSCRYGGEEFVVVMPDTGPEDAWAVAERIRLAVEAYDFPHGEKQPSGRLTISGGLSMFPGDGQGAEELIEHADQALYQSKRGGRNRVTRFEVVPLGSDADELDPDVLYSTEGLDLSRMHFDEEDDSPN